MIDKLTYDQVLGFANELKANADIVDSVVKAHKLDRLNNFAATVNTYAKFLEGTVEMYKDADLALQDLLKNK